MVSDEYCYSRGGNRGASGGGMTVPYTTPRLPKKHFLGSRASQHQEVRYLSLFVYQRIYTSQDIYKEILKSIQIQVYASKLV